MGLIAAAKLRCPYCLCGRHRGCHIDASATLAAFRGLLTEGHLMRRYAEALDKSRRGQSGEGRPGGPTGSRLPTPLRPGQNRSVTDGSRWAGDGDPIAF
ncbi:MAG: hypothetical protein E5X83_27440 [Mesorhizobium sp.]|nr:MAG: hypothetical protein EOR57_24935 [Mesorhizobium sp.]RWM67484.1 MAG: hypothetical protein EOR82_26745 [Mesorhizobium sp.]TIO21958.1 MAG: hypothetical protein E5X83_27440 [Mesorhizobium sp.]TJV56944.1 MAG: hypothetical protein E5X82_22870 [Mesorhizobium sp.]